MPGWGGNIEVESGDLRGPAVMDTDGLIECLAKAPKMKVAELLE